MPNGRDKRRGGRDEGWKGRGKGRKEWNTGQHVRVWSLTLALLEPDTSTVLHGTRKAKRLGEHTRSAYQRPAPLLAELVPHKESTARHTRASAPHPRDRSSITLRDAPYPHIIHHDRTLLPREYVASAPSTPALSHTFSLALD